MKYIREALFAGIVSVALTCISYGAGLAWPPAWWIVGGLSAIALAILIFVEV